ncbi:hypothetical protein ED733_005889 [Metarhizium rileyi]|uniref:mRNA N(6)-methyladenine demethylase n=1 Tax=Metarhizium rileyi (strain RCEF 4871) TaxID=1649241 RepID=A0A5C6GGD7_METRR|nr:hypothetical protein ED733_005889 [Metarhizium rileyi]
MTGLLAELDAHEQPSDEMRAEWKYFSRLEPAAIAQDPRIDDPRRPLSENGFQAAGKISKTQLAAAFAEMGVEFQQLAEEDAPVICHALLPGKIPLAAVAPPRPRSAYNVTTRHACIKLIRRYTQGLLIVPDLVPPAVQKALLSKMLHRDLSNPKHQTNMHLHYTLPYPSLTSSDSDSDSDSDWDSNSKTPRSFFALPPDSPTAFTPKDPSVHKPLSPRQVLDRRLHWVTLGGQYDWTNRVYPDSEPPPFPADLSHFLLRLFPDTLAQAAIVNFYSPGDRMMMHRDVSEEADRGLVSLSFGCDCLFMIAPSGAGPKDKGREDGAGDRNYLLLRLRSGDAIYMTAESRYAWHGVPKIIKGTCPDYLESWPAENGEYAHWHGWMKNKRINLNVRQIRE